MKNMRKLTSLLLVLALALCMAPSVLAADNGSITIKATMLDKEYDLYKIFDLTYDPGNAANIAYTIDSDWASFFTGTGADYIVDSNTDASTGDSLNLNAILIDGVTKYINITDSNAAEFSDAALAYAVTLDSADQTVTGTGGDVVENNLALGYYLVYPKGAADVKEGQACLCSLTSTNPDGEVDIKAEYPQIQKTASTDNADVGDTVTYTVTGKVPDTTGYTSYIYKITDVMTEGLTFSKDVSVKFDTTAVSLTDVTEAANAAATATVNYTTANGFELIVDMTKYQSDVGKAITVTYTAVVNDSAVTRIDENNAVLSYSNDPKNPTVTVPNVPAVTKLYSSKIVINKVKADGATPLANAVFVLKNSEGKFYQYTAPKAAEGDNPAVAADVEWVSVTDPTLANLLAAADAETITAVTTNETGTASFDGLADGAYYLVEIKAPDGYNLLSDANNYVEVTVAGAADTDQDGVVDDATSLTVTSAAIVNQTGTELPTTGGIGTTVFYILGGILVLGAIVLLITRKRMKYDA